jgi:hypothetical protein
MPSIYIPSSLRRLVTSRAHGCCEYCLLASEHAEFPHEIDHQVPIIHGGKSESDNLVFACLKCNRHKGTNLAAFDPFDGSMRAVFNPRLQSWRDHFALVGAFIIGLTPTGRATVALLKLSDDDGVERRSVLIKAGKFPPPS